MIFNELMTSLNEVVGMESCSDAPMTELEEMNAEIQEMIALESALDEEFAYNTLAFCDNAESTNALLAMREVALESTQGMDPAKIYEGFGIESEIAMEAAKDVLARKAYAGTAALKALIATCIKWLKSLFGITVASKKVFKSLETKAKDMIKNLNRKSGSKKIDSEKLKRDIPKYAEALNTLVNYYDKILDKVSAQSQYDNIVKSGKNSSGVAADKVIDDDYEAVKKIKEDLKDVYDKSSTDESTGTSLISTLTTALNTIKGIKSTVKVDDAGKHIKDAIKKLEDIRKGLEKRTADKQGEANNQDQIKLINRYIGLYQECASASKAVLKEIVKVSDDALTMSKGVLAAIY